jgi:DNA-binding transcriptional regulator of glucitol operon
MTGVRDRWLSKRAVLLHVAVLVAVPACAVAAWWQINRAQDGNDLSYLYSVMWPVFGVLAVVFWWMLIHTDYETVGLKGMQRQQAAASPTFPTARAEASVDPSAADDPELASYNERLAALAAEGPKTWRHRESVVVRRSQ